MGIALGLRMEVLATEALSAWRRSDECLQPDAVGVNRSVSRLLAPARAAFRSASGISIALLALIWIAIVGVADYWTGPEFSLLLFYLIPVTLGTWCVGRYFGIFLAALSIATSCFADVASGLPRVRYWNESMGLGSYLIFVVLLSGWRSLLLELEDRVQLRTAALQEEIAQRNRLEKEMNTLTERERRRLGHDLHNTLCQHLTGTALYAQSLHTKLAVETSAHTAELEKVVGLIEEGIDVTRSLARGFLSPDLNGDGLALALINLAQSAQERFSIDCDFQQEGDCAKTLNTEIATQLYRIAQEGVANACKHARASRIVVELQSEPEEIQLNIYDDGIGFAGQANNHGLGLRMMQHGADLIGANLAVKRNGTGGTLVSCTLNRVAT